MCKWNISDEIDMLDLVNPARLTRTGCQKMQNEHNSWYVNYNKKICMIEILLYTNIMNIYYMFSEIFRSSLLIIFFRENKYIELKTIL